MLRTILRSARLACACVVGVFLALGFKMFWSLGGVFLGAWLPVVAGAVWTVVCLPLVKGIPRPAALSVLALFWVALVPLGFPWDSRERFVHDLARVDPGMTPEQVDAVLGSYISGTGWPGNPFDAGEPAEFQVEGCEVYRHCDDCSYESDWGVVCFEGGRVSKVTFSPD